MEASASASLGYDPTGTMVRIRQQGSAQLALYRYDNLGRRAALGRYGVTVAYGYDGASRLSGAAPFPVRASRT